MHWTKLVIFLIMMLIVFALFVLDKIIFPLSLRDGMEDYYDGALEIRWPLYFIANICTIFAIVYIFKNMSPLPALEHPIVSIVLLILIFLHMVYLFVMRDWLTNWLLVMAERDFIILCFITAFLIAAYAAI